MESLRTFVEDPTSSRCAVASHLLLLLLILASWSYVLLSEHHRAAGLLKLEMTVVCLVFTVELLLRLLVSRSVASLCHVLNVMDLLALAAAWTALLHAGAPATLQMAWFLRIFRFVHTSQQLSPVRCARQLSWKVLSHIFNSSALAILAVLSFLVVVSASLLYLVESDRCEERGLPCSGFESIPASFWFSCITLTTVGYGDVYPFTTLGRALAAFLSVCSVILLSLSAALLSVNLAEAKMITYDLNPTEKEKLSDLKKSWDKLAHALAVASAASSSSVPARPTLQLLEDKGRSLCFELQECLTLMQT